jgi:hypothetical protein
VDKAAMASLTGLSEAPRTGPPVAPQQATAGQHEVVIRVASMLVGVAGGPIVDLWPKGLELL